MMYMIGYHDRFGKLCTLVKEVEDVFLVNQSPLEILNYSIYYIGYDLRGAFAASKRLLGGIQMLPVMVNPILHLCVFPTQSPQSTDTIWFNPLHIKRTTTSFGATIIEFSNGETFKVKARLSAFNDKIKKAEQLCTITGETGKKPNTTVLLLDPKKQKKVTSTKKTKENPSITKGSHPSLLPPTPYIDIPSSSKDIHAYILYHLTKIFSSLHHFVSLSRWSNPRTNYLLNVKRRIILPKKNKHLFYIGTTIKRLRVQLGKTQEDLAFDSNINRSHLSGRRSKNKN
jgi:competence protein ComK